MFSSATKILATAVSVAVLAVSVVGCGVQSDSEKDPSSLSTSDGKSDFITLADRACRTANKNLSAALDYLDTSIYDSEFADIERDSLAALTKLVADLKALKAPAKLSEPVSALADAIEASAARIKSEGFDTLTSGDWFRDVRIKAKAVGLTRCDFPPIDN